MSLHSKSLMRTKAITSIVQRQGGNMRLARLKCWNHINQRLRTEREYDLFLAFCLQELERETTD